MILAERTELTFDQPLVMIAAFVVGALAVARITRLIVDDEFPPVLHVTDWYRLHVSQPWEKLVECPWCVSPYIALIDIIWAWTSGLHWSWWLGNVWAAVAWIAGWLTVRDIPPDQRQ